MSQPSYKIVLPQFEGPFDLLLFFIERDELDIYDIPIAKITNDFLDYIRQMEALNIDMASEFILVAATLCRIKARLLLPRKEVDEEGNEIDPRDELVMRLLEYKRLKSVLEDMRKIEDQAVYIVEKLRPGHRSAFDDIFGGLENRIHAIVTFLALLELLNSQRVKLVQGLGYNNFWLELDEGGDEEE